MRARTAKTANCTCHAAGTKTRKRSPGQRRGAAVPSQIQHIAWREDLRRHEDGGGDDPAPGTPGGEGPRRSSQPPVLAPSRRAPADGPRRPGRSALAISPMPASEPRICVVSAGRISVFWFARWRAIPAPSGTSRDEVVHVQRIAAGDRRRQHLSSPWPRLSPGARARLGVAEGRLAPASASRICDCFSPSARRISDCRWPSASRITRALSRARLSSAGPCGDQVVRRGESLISMRVTLTPRARRAWSTTAQQALR